MKIGIFDSGVGGLSVLQEIDKYRKGLEILYLADTKHLPYGEKKASTIREYSIRIVEFFLSENVDMIIIACNTASASAYEYLKENISIPIFSIIDAGVNSVSQNDKILLLATNTTVNSHKYRDEIYKKYGINIFEKACPKFVEKIEADKLDNIDNDILEYIGEYKDRIDTILLGCTHFPLISDRISNLFKDKKIVDPAIKMLDNIDSNKIGENRIIYYSTSDTEAFKQKAERILNNKIDKVNLVEFKE